MTALSQRSGARTNRQLQENPVSLAIVYRPVERFAAQRRQSQVPHQKANLTNCEKP